MPRKVLLSFLGNNKYTDCCYTVAPYFNSGVVRFVQDALVQLHCKKWTSQDCIFIFLTKEAEENNWEGKFYDGDGLKNALSKFAHLHVIPVKNIPSGTSEAEIWALFKTLFDCLEDQDEVYLDITYGFRSLPMLLMGLLDYAKTLKDIKVKQINYGAFEVLGPAYKIKEDYPDPADRLAPIFDLASFSVLQDWTSAASEFIKLGKANALTTLMETDQSLLCKQLIQLEQSITTCRGKLLTQDIDFAFLKNTLHQINDSQIQEQLQPLISRIGRKIDAFENKATLNNGLAAVDWCIQHDMIQQGITFLQETLVSHLIEIHAGKENICERWYRLLAGGALQGYPTQYNNSFKDKNFYKLPAQQQIALKTSYEAMYSWVLIKAPLRELYSKLTGKGFRNDINHCGFQKDYRSPEELSQSLNTLFLQIKALHL